MGRWETGAITTGQCLQLNISNFTKYIKKAATNVSGSMEWGSGAAIHFKLSRENGLYYLELEYQKSDGSQKHYIKYRVLIVSVPSNLGIGEVYYFKCPFSFKRCKILYMGYGSYYFKSRSSYSHRIYYASQMSSRLNKHNDKYWNLEMKLEKLYKKHPKIHYRGKKTIAQLRIGRLEKKREYHDKMRWRILPIALIKNLSKEGITDVKDFI